MAASLCGAQEQARLIIIFSHKHQRHLRIILNFNTFSFHPQINAGISLAGYSSPTPIQSQTIPAILDGRDVLGLAQTGTGKTAAFVLPILEHLMKGPAAACAP